MRSIRLLRVEPFTPPGNPGEHVEDVIESFDLPEAV
jgi:hypothetical protein